LTVFQYSFAANQRRYLTMARYYVDCRERPSVSKCSIAISADSKEELLEASVQHAVAVHGHDDTAELRDEILEGIQEGTPAA
jgi:predicted small metal-binding protein